MLHCRDTQCESARHSEERDKVVLDVVMAMVESSYSSLPLTGKTGGKLGGKRIIPG